MPQYYLRRRNKQTEPMGRWGGLRCTEAAKGHDRLEKHGELWRKGLMGIDFAR